MATVNGFTAEKIQQVLDDTIESAAIVGTDLVFTKIGGATLNVGDVQGPPGNVGPPGEVSTAQLNAAIAGLVQSAAYAPAQVNWSIGSGNASTNAVYVFVGGPNVGDKGLLMMNGVFVFGSSGRSAPSSTDERFALPPGFKAYSIEDVGGSMDYFYVGTYRATSNGGFTQNLLFHLDNLTEIRITVPSGGFGTVVEGTKIEWSAQFPAKRI